jgi:hypothetical protein
MQHGPVVDRELARLHQEQRAPPERQIDIDDVLDLAAVASLLEGSVVAWMFPSAPINSPRQAPDE